VSEPLDEEAQRERAEQIRREIEDLGEPEPELEEAEAETGRRPGESLREFSERRMREQREQRES
jgi:hypothetical protein